MKLWPEKSLAEHSHVTVNRGVKGGSQKENYSLLSAAVK